MIPPSYGCCVELMRQFKYLASSRSKVSINVSSYCRIIMSYQSAPSQHGYVLISCLINAVWLISAYKSFVGMQTDRMTFSFYIPKWELKN